MTATWKAMPVRKRRGFNPAKDGRRFKGVEIGDQLMKTEPVYSAMGDRRTTNYWIVTDRWFDPVAGQDNPSKGDMVAVQRLDHAGKPRSRKWAHTLRGLASQQYKPADRDWIAFCASRSEEMASGGVVSIGKGHTLRKRPKMPGGGL